MVLYRSAAGRRRDQPSKELRLVTMKVYVTSSHTNNIESTFIFTVKDVACAIDTKILIRDWGHKRISKCVSIVHARLKSPNKHGTWTSERKIGRDITYYLRYESYLRVSASTGCRLHPFYAHLLLAGHPTDDRSIGSQSQSHAHLNAATRTRSNTSRHACTGRSILSFSL